MLCYKRIVVALICLILASCGITKIVEVPVEHTKIEYRDKIKYDSIYLKDSTIQKNKNDTVYLEKYKYIYKYVYLKDTITIVDSIPIVTVQEVTKEINKLHNWQVILMVLGGGAIAITGYKLIRIIKI